MNIKALQLSVYLFAVMLFATAQLSRLAEFQRIWIMLLASLAILGLAALGTIAILKPELL